jgi:hypothetical protein
MFRRIRTDKVIFIQMIDGICLIFKLILFADITFFENCKSLHFYYQSLFKNQSHHFIHPLDSIHQSLASIKITLK